MFGVIKFATQLDFSVQNLKSLIAAVEMEGAVMVVLKVAAERHVLLPAAVDYCLVLTEQFGWIEEKLQA